MASETWEDDRTPFEGVPGLRAAYFRTLYRFAMFLKRRNDSDAVGREARKSELNRQDEWDRTKSSPIADRAVNIILVLLFAYVLASLWSPFSRPSVEPGQIAPTERTKELKGAA